MVIGNSKALLMRLHSMRRVVLLTVIALVAAACGGGITRSSEPPPLAETTSTTVGSPQLDALADAKERWGAAAPDDYTVSQRDHCTGCASEPKTLAVRDGEVVSLASTETERIEDVFTTIEESLRNGAEVEVEYHSEFGYPVRLVIDTDGDGTPDIDLEFGDLAAMPVVASLGELLEAKRLWDAQHLDSYRFIFRADCTCPDGGTFEVEVRDGRVTATRPLDAAAETSDLSPGPLDSAFDDLEQWFTFPEDLINDGFLAVDVRMDPQFGYPRWFRIDASDIDDDHFAGDFTLIVTVDVIEALEPVEVVPDPDPDPEGTDLVDLDAARSRWESAAIASYGFVLAVHCECPAEVSGPFEIAVRDGDVTSAVHLSDGSDSTAKGLTIDELFGVIALSIADGTDVDVVYDHDLGYPRRVIIDPEAVAVDGGVALSITDFRVAE